MSEFSRILEQKKHILSNEERNRDLENAIADERLKQQNIERKQDELLKNSKIISGVNPRLVVGEDSILLFEFWQYMHSLGKPGAETLQLVPEKTNFIKVRNGILSRKSTYKDVIVQPELSVSAYIIGMSGRRVVATCEDGQLRARIPQSGHAILEAVDSHELKDFLPGSVLPQYITSTTSDYVMEGYRSYSVDTLTDYTLVPDSCLAETLANIAISSVRQST